MEEKDLGQRIEKYLSSKPKKCEALNKLVQALKVQKKSLNQCLYKLEKQYRLVRVQITPPVWALPGHGTPVNPQTGSGKSTLGRVKKKSTRKVPNFEAGPSLPVQKTVDISQFQDTELFGTDVGLDSDQNQLFPVEGHNGDTDDDDFDLNLNETEGATGHLWLNKESIGDVPLLGDQITTVNMKVETEEEMMNQNSDNMGRTGMFGFSESENMQEENLVNYASGSLLSGTIKTESRPDNEFENSGEFSAMNEPEFEQFNLMSQNEIKEEGVSQTAEPSQGLVGYTVGDSENSLSPSEEFTQQMPMVENYSIQTPELSDGLVALKQYTAEGDGENSLSPSEDEDMDANSVKEIDYGDMENCDKILKVLSNLPGVAQFVLNNKTKLARDDVEKGLEKCKSLGFVSGCSKLWKITPEGIDYIESRTGSSGDDKSASGALSAVSGNQSKYLYQTQTKVPGVIRNSAKVVKEQQQSSLSSNTTDRYHAYPNRSSIADVFARIRSQNGSKGSHSQNGDSAFKSMLPRNPMEILSRNTQPGKPVSQQSVQSQRQINENQSASQSGLLFLNSATQRADQPMSSSMTGPFQGRNVPTHPMEILSRGLKRTEISPPNTPQYTPTPLSLLPTPPHLLNPGSSLYKSLTGNQLMSLQSTNQNQSTVRSDLSSLPANLNKPNGSASMKDTSSLALSNESFNALNKNPVSALMEYAQARKMQARIEVVSQKGAAHRPTFKMAAFVGNRRFPVINCTNKKDGRKEACDIALRQLIAEGQFKAEAASESVGSKPQAPLESMTHFDKIAALTHRGFTALVSQITGESFAGRKVIAGLVMKRSDEDTGVLISLGTGNRCITGEQLSLQGNTVNDSHAEIITRRGFIRFLYQQLLDYDPSKTNPLFEKSPTGKLQIRPKISFHLYISTAPCGDGALFSPRDAESSKTPVDTRMRPPHDPVFSSNVQGLLRTKVEGGEGTIPIESGFSCQTFDGIQRGERLRTMSCTDKVCRWNVVGMQGALLSHFLEPVYLDSLTLGLLYDHGHLSRAVCCRVGRGSTDINEMLPAKYRLNHPWLGRVTVCDPQREVQKTKAISINWCFGDKGAEVTDGTTGLCNTGIENGFFSRCSKRHLYNSYKKVCEKFGRQDLLQAQTYKDSKMMATDFQQAREAMLKKFKENKYGPWVSKPVEEEMFGWEEQNC